MVIYIGADHRGFDLKNVIISKLKTDGYEVVDMGNAERNESDDYVDFAVAVSQKIERDPELGRGILLCGSGAGMDITANKFRRVRATLGFSKDQIYDARHDDNINILCLPAEYLSELDALQIIKIFLSTPFSGDQRFADRLEKIGQIENSW